MRLLSKLSVLVAAVLVLGAFASATPAFGAAGLCLVSGEPCPSGQEYFGTVTNTLQSGTTASFGSVLCATSTATTTSTGTASTFTTTTTQTLVGFSSCLSGGTPVTVNVLNTPWTIDLTWTSPTSGGVKVGNGGNPLRVELNFQGGMTCQYATAGITATFTDPVGTTPGTVAYAGSQLTLFGGTNNCLVSITHGASYTSTGSSGQQLWLAP